RWVLKWYRQVQDGVHPEIEVARFAGSRASPGWAPRWAGAWELSRKGRDPLTLSSLRESTPDARGASEQTLDELGRYFESVRSTPSPGEVGRTLAGHPLPDSWEDPSPEAKAQVGPFLESVRRMAEAVARLHGFLAQDPSDPAFAPETFTEAHRRSSFQALRRKVTLLVPALRHAAKALPPALKEKFDLLRSAEPRILELAGSALRQQVGTVRIRCHGDLGLSTLASMGADFVFWGLPGPAASPFVERRLRRCPLWDLAGLLASFHAATASALALQESLGEIAVDRWSQLERGALLWYDATARTLVRAYRAVVSGTRLEVPERLNWSATLRACMIERLLDELQVAFSRRPDGVEPIVTNLLALLGEVPGGPVPGPALRDPQSPPDSNPPHPSRGGTLPPPFSS
ncbi:MAG TPA: hypothetical protein VEN81_17025, partial [Planctomycetota bacterium]|nr:hypothetical protein [Planctomycetota bacterium]